MRHIRLTSLFPLLALLSCAGNEALSPDVGGSGQEILYTLAPVRTVTRSGEENVPTRAAQFSSFPADSVFGVKAYCLPAGKTWALRHSEADLYIDTERISRKGEVWKAWKSGRTYYWPHSGRLSFYSWAPYNLLDEGLTVDKENGLQIKGWTVRNEAGYGGATDYGRETSSDGSVDILTAGTYDVSGSDGAASYSAGVGIRFSHALCKVRFLISVDYDDPDKNWTVEKAVLRDIYTGADFSGGAWGNHSGLCDYTFEPESAEVLKAGVFTEIFPKTMMLPQPVSSSVSGAVKRIPRIEVTCWDGVSMKEEDGEKVKDYQVLTGILYSNTSGLLRWKEGTNVTYHLYISSGAENYIEFDASTSQWESVDGGDVELK